MWEFFLAVGRVELYPFAFHIGEIFHEFSLWKEIIQNTSLELFWYKAEQGSERFRYTAGMRFREREVQRYRVTWEQ